MTVHGDTSTCKNCGSPIRFHDVNPWSLGAKWVHNREYSEENRRSHGAHPDYCYETKAVPG